MEIKNYFPLETVIHNLSDIIQASNAPVTWWHLRFNRWWMESGPITIVRCSERENPPVAWVQHGAGQEWEVKWGRRQLRGIKTIKHIRSAPLLPFTLIRATVCIAGTRSILFQPLCQVARLPHISCLSWSTWVLNDNGLNVDLVQVAAPSSSASNRCPQLDILVNKHCAA